MSSFELLSEYEQIAHIESLIPKFAEKFGVKVLEIENLNYSFNATFKVSDGDSNKFAFRVNINSKKSADELAAEAEWLTRINSQGRIVAPAPIPALDNRNFASQESQLLQRDLLCIAYPWIDGEVPGDEPTDGDLVLLGRNMALLHESAANWYPGAPNFLPEINKTLLNSSDNLTLNQDTRIDDSLHSMIVQLKQASDILHETLSGKEKLQPIHADLHPHNVIRQSSGNQAVIDFDDCGIGFLLQDFANSIFYLRENFDLEKRILDGYSMVRNLPEFKSEDLELLLISRQIVLLNDLLKLTNPEDQEFVPTYLEYTRKRFQYFLETGRFKIIR